MQARKAAEELAARMGLGIKERRLALALRQGDVAERAGVSQPWVSCMERGLGRTASLETWAAVAAACDLDLHAYLSLMPGTTRPRDYEHLKRQQLVASVARPGGWTPDFEARADPDWPRSRAVDVLLTRARAEEAAVVEVWDALDDVGSAWRGLDGKVAVVQRARPDWAVAGLMVVRGTRRIQATVREFGDVFRVRHPASGADWLRALTTEAPMPRQAGLLWTDVAGTRLVAARL